MYHVACEMLEACCPRAAALLEEAEPDALAYLDFPQDHWKRLRTNNVQERANREIKRRSRVVQVFPSEKSLLGLAGAVMCDQDEAWSEARYFSAAKMAELHDEQKPVFFTTTKFRISRLISFGFHRFAKVPHPFFANCPIFPSSRLPRTFCSARRTQPADHDA